MLRLLDCVVDWHRIQGLCVSSLSQERPPTQNEHGIQFGTGILRPRGRIRKEVGRFIIADAPVMTYSG